MTGFIYEKNEQDIVTITMDMEGPVNTMNEKYMELMAETIERLESEKDSFKGVIIASAKKTFFAGGDLNNLLAINKGDEEEFFKANEINKQYLRRLEKLGKPVVAAINGAALGGGCEICLACNYRVAINDPKSQIGMPEVSLGLLPGAGGVVRTVRMLGLQNALPLLLEGKRLKPERALKAGLIDELADDANDMIEKAVKYINANPEAVQPFDVDGYKIPGGDLKNPNVLQVAMIAPSMLLKKTKDLMPAPKKILSVAVESLRVDVDTALRIESRGFTSLITSDVAKNMITTFFFQLNELNAGGSRPKEIEKTKVKKVGILGAGMMGQGIAYVSAKAGIEVILKDISMEAAEIGKDYSRKICDKLVSKKRMDGAKKDALLNLIKPVEKDEELEGCDLIIEAVFENIELKKKLFKDTEKYLTKNGVYGSNTSTLPITELSKAVSKPENFIGLHFFSPVEKMPLLEIITSHKTNAQTLAKSFDYAQQIKKVPIVVNDSRGFFTSRVFGTFIDEGCKLLKEGVDPVLIDKLARMAGMPVGPLEIHDEVSQELSKKVAATNRDLDKMIGQEFSDIHLSSVEVGNRMIDEFGRGGRAYGGGYYEYPENGKKYIWPKLYELYHNPEVNLPHQDIKDRILFRQVIESLKCYEEGVFESVINGNIGSIMGIGFPPHTGGVFQFINTYGLNNFVKRVRELSDKYGSDFEVPQILLDRAEKEELFV
ncbi:MAG: 3-hydroxyacyl-CoA dehydrogenase [Desulfobacterales bacterium]|nr:3-hydroxyacyl-CoA dehydrogenase [Desulfobacterales bacterium]